MIRARILKANRPCICGHTKENHNYDWCGPCGTKVIGGFIQINNPHFFKLDNLQYVEDLAKVKGLV